MKELYMSTKSLDIYDIPLNFFKNCKPVKHKYNVTTNPDYLNLTMNFMNSRKGVSFNVTAELKVKMKNVKVRNRYFL